VLTSTGPPNQPRNISTYARYIVQEIVGQWNLPYFSTFDFGSEDRPALIILKSIFKASKVVISSQNFSQNKKSSFVAISCLTYGKKVLKKYFKGLKNH
jgi:hypothetical protein